MSFSVAADAYDAFMGRWSRLLSAAFADFAGVVAGMRVVDVGCGTGALSEHLVARIGPGAVTGVDPSPSFVAAMRHRFPGINVHEAPAASLGPDERDRLCRECERRIGGVPIVVTAAAWAARGRA